MEFGTKTLAMKVRSQWMVELLTLSVIENPQPLLGNQGFGLFVVDAAAVFKINLVDVALHHCRGS